MLSYKQNIKLKRLLLKQTLYKPNQKTNSNYKALFNSLREQRWGFDDKGKPALLEGYAGFILEGSSRSGKTWSSVDFIIYICLFVEKKCVINIVRETYNEFKTTLYDDFKRRMNDFGLPHPFDDAQDVKTIKIGKNKINFIGADKLSKKLHGAGSDYTFFNEILHIPKATFRQLTMRCRKFWWGDYNPSVTQHWVYKEVIPRKDVGYLHTTFKDNPHITGAERNAILITEPWKTGSYKVKGQTIYYRGQEITDKHFPPPHPENNGKTSDEDYWRVYGLGLRGSVSGLIFKNVRYIDNFPDHVETTFANDFGFTNDPNATVEYAEDDHNIYAKLICYKPIDSAIDLSDTFEALGMKKDDIVACDSSDKYTGGQDTVEMVKDLNGIGWENTFKIRKTNGVMYWIGSMKKKRLNIVKSNLLDKAKFEIENYKLKQVHGITINQPVDKDNHFIDGVRYGHMSHNQGEQEWITTQTPSEMGITY